MEERDKRLRLDDGSEITLAEFLAINELEPHEIAELRALPVGETINYGGGAFALTSVTRID